MTNSHDSKWVKIRNLEDALAMLDDINQERILLKCRALAFCDEESFQATQRQRKALEKFKFTLSARWHELMEDHR